jgi:hypothetical protein
VGIGYGLKEAAGAGVLSSRALRIYVRKKLPKGEIRNADFVPEAINGLLTDVIPVLSFQASGRPAEGGESGAHRNARPGTSGCLTRDRNDSANYILSCYHVLADEDDPVSGDDVFEPALADGGFDAIGKLQRRMNLNPSGNVVDCALARINNPGDFLPELRNLGRPNPAPLEAAVHQTVKKSGRNFPFVTLGVITDVSADVMVDYRRGPVGFVQQIAIRGVGGLFAEKGDSGLVLAHLRRRNSVRPKARDLSDRPLACLREQSHYCKRLLASLSASFIPRCVARPSAPYQRGIPPTVDNGDAPVKTRNQTSAEGRREVLRNSTTRH